MTNLDRIKSFLSESSDVSKHRHAGFFKTGPGQYAEHDRFMRIKTPVLRKIAKDFKDLSYDEIQTLIESPFNEERLLALFILINLFQKSESHVKDDVYKFYLLNLKHVNNWNLVDASAHLILGAYLFQTDRTLLFDLSKSGVMWERRISIVATWCFIRKNDLDWTFKIAQNLLDDSHDLIHKAVGWMLREAGKKDQDQLIEFLNQHSKKMQRTMLRYAIEKFPEHQRKSYLDQKKLFIC